MDLSIEMISDREISMIEALKSAILMNVMNKDTDKVAVCYEVRICRNIPSPIFTASSGCIKLFWPY